MEEEPEEDEEEELEMVADEKQSMDGEVKHDVKADLDIMNLDLKPDTPPMRNKKGPLMGPKSRLTQIPKGNPDS